MKAEHRKELETNILADKVGKILTGAKQGPTRGLLFYVIIAVVVLAAIFIVMRFLSRGREKDSQSWAAFEEGGNERLEALFPEKSNAGKAAQFQIAWRVLWFGGLKQLGTSPKQARAAFDDAESIYKKLAEKCKGDPVFEPEALFALAVIEETRLLDEKNREDVKPVIDKYKDVVKASKESAFAQLAKARIEEFEKDDTSRSIVQFYQDLEKELDRRQPSRQPWEGLDAQQIPEAVKNMLKKQGLPKNP